MTKNFNAKQFIKQYPKELHPFAEEKMKCCEIISSEWLKKLEKSLKSPFSHIPNNFSKCIEDLVDSDGKLLHNLKRGKDYDLVTCFMFDNLARLSDPKENESPPRRICCGLGHDPMTGEDIVVFDLVAFNIKMIRCNRELSRTDLSKTSSFTSVTGERWYASASWTFGDFLRQFCEIVNMDENTHRFYKDPTLEEPVNLSSLISSSVKGRMTKITARDLYFGPSGRSGSKSCMKADNSSSMRIRHSISNEKSMPNKKTIEDSSAFPSQRSNLKNHYSKATVISSSSSMNFDSNGKLNRINTGSDVSSSSFDSQDKDKVNSSKDEQSIIMEYRYSPSNDLVVPKLEPTGFENLSNSCYMNAVIQCFIHIPPISSLYFGDDYVDYINLTNKQNSQGNVSKEFHNIISDLATLRYNSINPYSLNKFRTAFTNQYLMFNSSEQQDAQEFLICLIDGLHEDMNQAFTDEKKRRKVLETLSPNESPWSVCKKLNNSQIYKIFLGMTETKLTCQVCSHSESIKEPFVVLSLPIPASFSRTAHLEDLIKHYCQKEIIGKTEKVRCEKCQKKTNTKKSIKIEQCGEILIIAFKRFENTTKGGYSSFKKNDINIIYPKVLNMNPYSSNKIGKYMLIGCVYHYGSLDCGHYTASVLDQVRDTWYNFNDATVNQTVERNVHNRNAYILFYQKE
ncbi:hypothetical protein M9Y10_016209 [Tritrichomonas musculus]|uniref:ubiquitinyl hydrolase 1 n=1 Tax=Tritrichomonas musculus TaxID=1915356 RepID=A0ABR2I5V5_9EUKA